MKDNLKTIFVITLSVAAGVVGSYFVFNDDDAALPKAGGKNPSSIATVVSTKNDGKGRKTVTKISLDDVQGKKVVRIEQTEQPRPGLHQNFDENVEEEKLTERQRGILKELQDALDDDDLKRVRKALRKFVAKVEDGGLGGQIPVCMRAKAVEALGWFGKNAAIDLVGFVADSNEDVSNDAFSAFEQALTDCEMSDGTRSQLLTSMMSALTDVEQIDSLLDQLNGMRNSVKAQTVKDILSSGTKAAKEKMLEEMGAYLDEGISNADGIDRWLATNPDDPDDAEFYGGQK